MQSTCTHFTVSLCQSRMNLTLILFSVNNTHDRVHYSRLLVSAGFDAAVGDPIGGCLVTPQGFAMMTYLLKSLANGKLMLALEGGYNVEAVARSSEACMKVLLGEAVPRLPQPMPPSHTCLSIVERVIQVQSEFWSSIVPKSPSIPENPSAKSLTSVVDAYWKAVCRDQFDLLSFPILPEQFRGYFDGRVHVSPNVLDASDALVIFAHEQDMVVQTSPIDSNIVHQDTAFIQPALSSFIELSLAKDLKVIDICVPRKTWKLRQTSTGSPEDLQLYNQFFLYLWNTIISKCSTRNIVFVSSGLCNYSITKLTEIPGKNIYENSNNILSDRIPRASQSHGDVLINAIRANCSL